MTQTLNKLELPAEFKVRLDQYWQSIAVYSVTLILYVVIKSLWDSELQQGIVNVVLTDPVVVLLTVFVLASTVALLASIVSRRVIVIAEDGITFRSRFHERTFTLKEIDSISTGPSRRVRIRGLWSVIRVRIKGRRRFLRIRPAVYNNEEQLISAILTLKNFRKQDAA